MPHQISFDEKDSASFERNPRHRFLKEYANFLGESGFKFFEFTDKDTMAATFLSSDKPVAQAAMITSWEYYQALSWFFTEHPLTGPVVLMDYSGNVSDNDGNCVVDQPYAFIAVDDDGRNCHLYSDIDGGSTVVARNFINSAKDYTSETRNRFPFGWQLINGKFKIPAPAFRAWCAKNVDRLWAIKHSGHLDAKACAEAPAKYPDSPALEGVVGMEKQVAALHMAMSKGKPAMLVGPTGCGKTHLVRAYCAWMNSERVKAGQSALPLVIHTFHQESSPTEITGTKTLVAGNVAWEDSEFMKVFENGGTYFADEFNFAPGGAHAPLFAALNGDPDIFVPESKKTYVRHPDFKFVAACNPASKYAGRQPVDKALASRFFVSAEFGYLAPAEEKSLLMSRVKGLSSAQAEKVVTYAQAVRKAEADGAVFVPFGTRDAIHCAELLASGFPWEDAAKLGFANKSDNDDQKNELVKLTGAKVEGLSFKCRADYELENDAVKKENAKLLADNKAMAADLKKASEIVKSFESLKAVINKS